MKKRNWYLIFGGVMTAAMLAFTVLGLFWTPYESSAMSAADKYARPSAAHLFGCDQMGRDIFSRTLEGAGFTLTIALAVALPKSAMTVKLLRGSILGELGQDYIRTAYSKGNSRGSAMRRHVLRNAMIPVVTFLAMAIGDIMAGSIVVEQVFGIPGLGRMLIASINNQDYPVVQAIVVFIASVVVLCNFLADLLYRVMDPRIDRR